MVTVRIGLLHSGLRAEEKLLAAAAKKSGAFLETIDIRKLVLNPKDTKFFEAFDIFLERSISTVLGNATIEFLDNLGILVVNEKVVVDICNDKFQTASVLDSAEVPNLKSLLVFNENQATKAIDYLGGFPVVLKSREGSWGRLMGKINDVDSLEAVFSHREFMGPAQRAVILQEYIKKPSGRDIRAFVIDGTCICAIYRTSPHWITNTARGGEATNCKVSDKLQELCKQASDAVGGGILAMDIFETKEGLKINEINHTMEFKNSEKPTGVSISGAIIDYCIKIANN